MIPIIVLLIELVNVALLLMLLSIYVGMYRKVKSDFTLGLIIFTSAFLVKSLALIATLRVIFRFLDEVSDTRGAPLFLLIVNAIETAGLLMLLKISWD
jgi:hypothetical protein